MNFDTPVSRDCGWQAFIQNFRTFSVPIEVALIIRKIKANNAHCAIEYLTSESPRRSPKLLLNLLGF